MMKFDTIIIGGGLAGYTAAMRSLELGKRTAMISQGQSALHFSSGSVDVLGNLPGGADVIAPREGIDQLSEMAPKHPYSKLGSKAVFNGVNWFSRLLGDLNIPLRAQASGENHQRITPLGTLKTTYLSQPYVEQWSMDHGAKSFDKIVVVGIDGFRDFHAQMVADNLARNPDFDRYQIHRASVRIAGFDALKRNPCELRSIDIARLLRSEEAIKALANQLLAVAAPGDLVVMPAIVGNGDGLIWLNQLHKLTGLTIHEVPTMPPSLLGIRIEEALSRAFIRRGGTLLKGDQVVKGDFRNSGDELELIQVYTRNHGAMTLAADHFILATGSFFSMGLKADRQQICEPVFSLDMAPFGERDSWHQPDFFTKNPHPFMAMGVETNNSFNPSIGQKCIRNLYCAGAVLAHYNPVTEGSGGGVAIATGFHAASQTQSSGSVKPQLEEAL